MRLRIVATVAAGLSLAACSSSSSTPPAGQTTCTSFTYSAWGACQVGGTQTRTVVSSSPAGCTGGSPVTSQPCTYGAGAMRFSGAVKRDTGSGQPTALSGADVRASIDRDGDGLVEDGEFVTTRSATDGTYALDIPVSDGDLVVVRFTRAGSATLVRTVKGAPGGEMLTSATLKDLEDLRCSGGSCIAPSGLSVSGLPPGTSGSARVFNPVTESSAFPGSFSDSSGNLLQSGVFATFALEDQNGDPVEHLTSTATIKMKLPRDTWSLVRDTTPGDDRIQVPLYAFDEVKGTWVLERTGYLEDGEGQVVPESAAASIRDGSYTATLYAVGDVSHFSSWNCDWPVSSHGRVGGTVGECWWNGERKPCAGATVTASGATYTGTSTPVTVGADGRFAIDVMRSEAPGEDLDGNGVTGETTRVIVRVVWNGQVYDVGTVPLPSTATSGGSVTKDMGTLVLDDSNRLQARMCTVSGTVRTAGGAPATEGVVWAWDESIPSEILEAMCLTNGGYLCTPFTSVDPSGAYSVVVPEMGALTLFSWATRNPDGDPAITEWTQGTRTFTSCPAPPVTLTMDQGWLFVNPTIQVSGGSISWTPAGYGASALIVVSASDAKWMLSSEAPMMSPITYGSVPAGATQTLPTAGSPPALAAGDEVTLLLSGITADGFMYWGSATTTL